MPVATLAPPTAPPTTTSGVPLQRGPGGAHRAPEPPTAPQNPQPRIVGTATVVYPAELLAMAGYVIGSGQLETASPYHQQVATCLRTRVLSAQTPQDLAEIVDLCRYLLGTA